MNMDANEKKRPKCILCNSTKNISVHSDLAKNVDLCKHCSGLPIFNNLFEYQKISAVCQGKKLAKSHKLYVPFAINVALGRYSLAEAQRRTKLRNTELDGKSVDAYSVAKRTGGSFRSVR